jgi:predicted RNase H-like HicB family nuclease
MPERSASAARSTPPNRKINVRIRKAPNGWWSASSPDFYGALASGRSLDTLRKHIRKLLMAVDRDFGRATIVESIEPPQDLKDAMAAITLEREHLETRRQFAQRQLAQG